jgi:hypothetical protein
MIALSGGYDTLSKSKKIKNAIFKIDQTYIHCSFGYFLKQGKFFVIVLQSTALLISLVIILSGLAGGVNGVL